MTKTALTELPALVEHWVDEGLVSEEQARQLLVEAFAYLGGVVVLVAAGVLAARYWEDLGAVLRTLLAGACALLLLAAGAAVPRRLADAAVRLTSVLWALSTGAVALCIGLAVEEWTALRGADAGLVIAGVTAAYAFVLWRRSPVVLTHLVLFAGVMATAAAAAAHADAPDGQAPGVAMWGTALAWILLTWGGLLGTRRVGYLTGAIGLLVGGLATLPGAHTWPILFALVTAAGVVAAGVALSDLALLGIGAVGTLQVLPRLVERFFPHGVSGPLLLMAVGVALLGAALRLSQRSQRSRRSTLLDRLPPSTVRLAVLAMHVG